MIYYALAVWALLLFSLSSTTATAVDSEPDQSLVWGTYRPNLYFGLKPRFPESLMTGLMWFGTQDYQSFVSEHLVSPSSPRSSSLAVLLLESRHACSQEDALDSYTYTHHDARQGAIQEIKDSLNNVHLTIEWLKVPGGDHGGSWAARIKGEPIDLGTLFRCVFRHGPIAELWPECFQTSRCAFRCCGTLGWKVSEE
jgi:mannosyl-oligosaccharide glucosidase